MKTLKLTAIPEASESEVQSALIRRLRAAGWMAIRVNSTCFKDARGQLVRSYDVAGMAGGSAGFPDVLALRGSDPDAGDSIQRGPVVARLFEVKRRGGLVSESQKRFATFAGAFRVEVEVVEGFEALDRLEF